MLHGELTPGEWGQAIDAWLPVLRVAGRRKATLTMREYQIRRFAAAMPCGPWEVTGEQLVEWVDSHGWGRESLRAWRAALRGFYGWARQAGLTDTDPSLALPSVKPAQPRPRPAPENAYRAALAAADERVRLMVRLAAEIGLRRGEVARSHFDDLERDLFGWSLVVHGKGGKQRRVPVPDGLALAIRERGPGYLFPGRDGGHLSAHYVGKLVARALPGAWAMHSLRHRFATAAYAQDRDLLTVQELMGHGSPVTTKIYVQLPPDAMRRTVNAVSRL